MSRQRSSVLAVLCIVAAASLLGNAHAHGGGLHKYSYRQDVRQYVPAADIRNDVHVTLGTCANLTALNLTALTPGSWTLPWFPGMLNVTAEGSIDIISYLSNNCTNSANTGLFPMLRFSVSIAQGNNRWVSRPMPYGMSATAYGFQGTCSAPGNLYRNNLAQQDNRFNLAWWGYENTIGFGVNSTDVRPGVLWGAAPQSWFLRNATDAARMRSIVVLTQSGPAFCCNVNYTGFPAPDAALALGRNCSANSDDK